RTEEIIEAQKKQDADNALAATNSEKTLSEEKKNLILPETSEAEEEKATETSKVEEEKAEERKEKTENQ
ncbi:MAG: hypothetical protein WC186_06110, partial [Bacteroidales bacterium]